PRRQVVLVNDWSSILCLTPSFLARIGERPVPHRPALAPILLDTSRPIATTVAISIFTLCPTAFWYCCRSAAAITEEQGPPVLDLGLPNDFRCCTSPGWLAQRPNMDCGTPLRAQ